MRRFVSVWLPELAIERFTCLDPKALPVDTPFALVENGPRGLVITAVDAVARRQGLGPGLSLADARAAIPALLAHPAALAEDARYLADLALWAGRYGPDRNTDGPDGLWIEITGAAHLFGGEHALAADLVTRLAGSGLTARIAIAGTREAAHAFARFAATAHGPVVITTAEELEARLAALPVAALALAPDTLTLLRRLGLSRIGLLYGLPRAALARRFSEAIGRRKAAARLGEHASTAVLDRLDVVLGRAAAPRKPLTEPPLYCVRLPFAEPLISPTGIALALGELTQFLCARLDATGTGARALRLMLWRADSTAARIEAATSAASRDPAHLEGLIAGRLEQLDLGPGIDLATLEAIRVEPLAPSQVAIRTTDRSAPSPAALATLIDRLTNRLGSSAVHRIAAATGHIPERAQRRLPALAGATASAARAPAHPFPQPSRPAFLFTPPEPIAVVAEVPDGPPARFVWRRVAHVVTRADGPERIAPEWWCALPARAAHAEGPAETPPRPLTRTRDYYRIEDTAGARYWVFRDGLYGAGSAMAPPAWYMHGLFG